ETHPQCAASTATRKGAPVKHRLFLLPSTLLSCAACLAALPLAAQEPAPAPPAPAPPVPEPPAPPKHDLGPINVAAWGRADVLLHNDKEPEKLNDVASTGLFEIHTSGKLHEYFAFTANLVASYGGGDGISGSASLLDGIVQFEPDDLFHLWVGRNL